MATRTTDYRSEAQDDAADFVENFIDEIVEQLVDNGEASDDFNNDYDNGDAYHHENHTDKCYDLSEAADVIDQLHEYEETDTGLWDGLGPREAVSAQAAYTYGNAVYSMAVDLIKEINGDDELETILECREMDIDEIFEKIARVVPEIVAIKHSEFDAKLRVAITDHVKKIIEENR